MKRKLLLMGLILALVLFTITACGNSDYKIRKQILSELEIDISSGKIISNSDDHGGFHGDGTLFTAVKFQNDSCIKEIENNNDWKQLPLPQNLTALLYGVNIGNTSIGPFINDNNLKPIFPAVKNGYYYFYDRHSESTNPKDDTEVLNRNSFNLTIALYDTDNDILYFCRFDT